MRVLLFGGFLGSGKTSIILQLARQITERRRESVAIIENEAGETSIDDKLLAGAGFTVKPLFGGCVCCQITGDLAKAIEEIGRTLNPAWLIIEMTGLAVPANVVKVIRKYQAGQADFRTVTVVDAGRWFELREILEPLVNAQVESADFVIINKTDLAGGSEAAVADDVRTLAGKVPLLYACAAGSLPDGLIEEILGNE